MSDTETDFNTDLDSVSTTYDLEEKEEVLEEKEEVLEEKEEVLEEKEEVLEEKVSFNFNKMNDFTSINLEKMAEDLPSSVFDDKDESSDEEYEAIVKNIQQSEENELIIINQKYPQIFYEKSITEKVEDFSKLFPHETTSMKEIKKIIYNKLGETDVFKERFNQNDLREIFTQCIVNKQVYNLKYNDYIENILNSIFVELPKLIN